MSEPVCGKCGKVMTPQNAFMRPELFLHDDCLPDEYKPTTRPLPLKEYLGDSVYAEFDGFTVTLYLDNGEGRHSEIVLEPSTFVSLERFMKRCENR